MIGKPVITSFTVSSDVLDQPPVLISGPHAEEERWMVVSQLKIVLERFGPDNQWGAREVWIYGQVEGDAFSDLLCWRDTHTQRAPNPVQDSPSLPDWVADFVKERLQRTT